MTRLGSTGFDNPTSTKRVKKQSGEDQDYVALFQERNDLEKGVEEDQAVVRQEGPTRKLRKRPQQENVEPEKILREFINSDSKIIIFSGSGLSATSGMSMFSTENGLYDRARKKFKQSDGKRLFQYQFYEKSKPDVNKFYCEIYKETQTAIPSQGHRAIGVLERQNRLVQTYLQKVSFSSWKNTVLYAPRFPQGIRCGILQYRSLPPRKLSSKAWSCKTNIMRISISSSGVAGWRSEEHTSELQSRASISYAVF
eukprot:TRINITY_DN17479_c0_g1_i1.p1 TRINITY_DN17479_c0_g1~~TRINITY_DN17479_c0_g1_i1.p1  ORF type:complete len:254 (+),score=9.16 TRINITY_DN17479_c0_g1_i1:157-918(+)